MQKNRFGSKMWDNPVDHNRNAKWILTVEKELEMSHKVILTSLKRMFPYIFRKCQIEKRQALMDYMDSG